MTVFSERHQRINDAAILIGVFFAYLAVRVAWAPRGGIARYHLTDLLAGIAIPSLAGLVFAASRSWRDWARSLRGKLAFAAGATLVWEGVMPLTSQTSTADPIDALCYLAGAALQHALVASFGARALVKCTTELPP